MVGQRIGGDIVGGEQGTIHQVAEAHGVPRLETGGTARAIRESGVGQRHGDGKIDFLEVRPIENHHAGGDLRKAGDLEFLLGFFGFEDLPGLVVEDDVTFLRLDLAQEYGPEEERQQGLQRTAFADFHCSGRYRRPR